MSEQSKPFVVTDRRRHTMEGDLRPDVEPAVEPVRETSSATGSGAPPNQETPSESPAQFHAQSPAQSQSQHQEEYDEALPQAPTPEQRSQANLAYTQTADRLTTAIRAANPGMDHPPPMNFDGLVQSVYMTAIMQLGGATPEGQQPQVDLMGAQQSIEMLTVLGEKTAGNLTREESALLDRAIFELQVAFLEITQALARSAAAKQQGFSGPGGPGAGPRVPGPGPGGRPSIVR